ncbi:MAG: glucose-1-phosphate adenylyltransferase [Firmicutes bacterium]|nr:glucose-1-phosphate adenylyltransferase [Bacillota bacterium]
MKKKCIAMLLAGGQGSRLGLLTGSIAKPAVSFGGKYRIIDFSLSNCVNSGIDTVGVLIQYKPLILNKYLGTGEAWDLDNSNGGVHILPPYAGATGGQWYEGTADAIYHNIDFIDMYNPENVLILSGDHIYKMDYNEMLEYHEANNSDLTVSVMEVPMEEASRFGIMSTDEDNRITKFAEKPKEPESNLASMGIYIFSWPVLKKALLEDHDKEITSHDFGKDLIPTLLGEGKNLFAYNFDGYWKDVGTVSSYYESQMDILYHETMGWDLFSRDFRVMSNSNMYPPQLIGPDAEISDSMICNGCNVMGKVTGSILGSGAIVEEGAVVKDSILLPNSYVGKNCQVTRIVLNEGAEVKDGETVGSMVGDIQVIGEAKLSI